MKKTPGFYALFTAILMVLSVASYAADGTKYFCLKEIKDQYDYPVQLELRQVESGDADETCFEYWFNETKSNPANSTDPMPDAYRFIEHWLGMYMNPVVLKSDIVFAGHNSSGCIDSHDAFKGKYLELSEGRGLWSESGKNYTISGLCYASNQANEGIGFVSITNGSSSGISNVKFSDVYFKMTGSGSHAGVVYLDYEYYANTFDGIDIEDSYFEADYAGALLGYTLNYNGDIQNVTIKNVTINSDYHAGAVAGYIEGGFVTLKNVAVTKSKVESETNAGGLVGFTDGSIAITKSYYQGSVSSKSIAGGIVGLISGGGTVKINNTFSKGRITGGTIQGSSAAGYIVGSIDTPFNYSSYVTLYNNFHFGDDTVEKGVGGDRFYADGLVWSEGYSYGNANIYANVRNATGTLTATGPLGYYVNESYDCSGGCYVGGTYVDFFAGELGQTVYVDPALIRHANGIVRESDMNSGLLAALLNYNLEANGDAALWVSNAENDGLPTFVGTSDKPNHLVVVQIKDLSNEQKASLNLVDYYTRFVTEENTTGFHSEVMAFGFFTYTEANGKLNSDGVDKIEAVKKAFAANANLNKDFVSFVDAAGNPVSLTDEISSSLICETPVTYDIVYRYCDGDPSLGTSNCANIDNIVDKTFIFMAPRVNRLFSNASLKKIVIPMVFELGKSTGLQYDIAFLDEYGYSITVGSPVTQTSNMAYWLAYDVINDSYSRAGDVKKIVLTYYPSTYSITENSSINIEVQNPEAVKFTLEMSGDVADGSSHEIVGAVSNINQNTQKPGNISVPLTRYLKVKDIECNTGYTCDGTYSISFRATKQVVCADGESPAETEVDYSATADEILAGVSGDCSASTWHVDGLKSKHGSEDGDEVDLTNSLIAREMDHGITTAFLTVTPNFVAGPFYVTYDLNTNADKKYLYFPVNAKESEKLEFSKAVHSVSLWQPYNANLMCFDGWSVTDPLINTPQDKYKDLSEANAIQENLSMDPDAPTTLYANWSTCVDAPATKITIANGNTKATLNLKQTFDGVVYEHMLDDQNIVLAGGTYEFTIDDENSAVLFGYAKGDITASVEVTNNDGSESTPEDVALTGNVVVISTQDDNQQKPSQNTIYSLKMGTSIVPLRFVLDVNAPIDSVFYGMGFDEFEREFADGEALPSDIYRTEYKLSGWRFENGKATATPVTMVYQAQTHEFFNDEMVQDYNMYYKAYGRYPDTLYAVWTVVNDPQVNLVINKSHDIASFKLSREIAGRKIEYLVSDTLKVPAECGFEFNVETIYDTREWMVDGKFPITLIAAAGDTIGTVEDFFMVNESMYLIANLKSANTSVRVALDENSKDSVFFGSDWTEELTSDNPDSAMVLPTIVYNAEKCLAGWTTDPESDELLTVIDKDLLSKLRAKGKSQGVDVRELLYAKWTTNLDSCAGAFMKLAVEQENGSIWFAEGDKDKTVERRFTEEGTMFVPMELNGRNFRVRAMGADTSVYVLDSLVVMRDGIVDTVLHVGDYMPEILDNVTLKAYFGWKNKTKLDFARARLDSTGSMFKLSFTASDFEVRRKVSAKVQVVDIVKDSIVTQSVFGDSIAMGFDTTFVFRMKKPGNYRMVVTLEDKTGVKEKFSREISVDPVISSIAADSWQMLSLSAVDMSAVTWDGDQVFYWWDEYGTGEFWQYKQLTKNDSLDATRGVWYNSLEGRSLPLRDEIDDEGEDFVWKLDKANSGWNMVANPHGWAVNLFANYPNAVKEIDENPEMVFWSWNTTTGQYDPMFEEIGPYEAVWVQVSKDTKWKVSAAPAFKGESKAVEKSRSLAKSKTKDHWTLQAKLFDTNGKQDSWNILGAGLNPLATEEPPESMADHVNLSIVDGKRALAKSIKEASDEMEWTIALSASSDRIGYLSFDGIDGIKDYGYRVFVTVDGNTTEMQNGVPLKVYLKSTAKTATVRVAPAARVVAQNTLKGLRMARLGNQLRVSFEASEGLAGTNARVDILDMKGHVMATASTKAFEGSNALVLDAPQTGLYMLRVRAGSEQQAKKIVVK